MTGGIEQICFISDAPHYGGAERYVVDMCAAARRMGIGAHVHWLAPEGQDKGDRGVFDAVLDHGATTSRQAKPGTRAVARMLREKRPGAVVINACGRPHMWRTPWACRALGIPSAWVHHMVDPVDPRRLALDRKMHGLNAWRVPQALRHRLAAAGASCVIASNDRDAAYLNRWGMAPREKLRIIAPGFDPGIFRFDAGQRRSFRQTWIGEGADDTFVIGTAARLIGDKGLETLIDAVQLLTDDDKNIALLVAGAGPQAQTLARQVRHRGLEAHVRLLGFVKEMPGFYSALDAFALCSRTESFGLALTEAMACGRAVLATPTHGALGQIRHRCTGLVLEGFSAGHIAHSLRTLRDAPDLRAQLGRQAAIEAPARFTIDATLNQTLAALAPRPRDAGMNLHQNPASSRHVMEVPT